MGNLGADTDQMKRPAIKLAGQYRTQQLMMVHPEGHRPG
jgi:hypothetical protein